MQIERIRAYAQAAGLSLTAVLQDRGVSASKPLRSRPRGGELLDLVGQGTVSAVVALKLDRIFRNALDALHNIEDWDREGVALHLIDFGGAAVDTHSPAGKFIFTVLAAMAQMERAMISDRTGSALAYLKAHLRPYSPTPYGYVRVGDALVWDSAEQAVIEQMLDRRREGWGWLRIANQLNALGVPTKEGRGGGWYPSVARRILGNSLHRR